VPTRRERCRCDLRRASPQQGTGAPLTEREAPGDLLHIDTKKLGMQWDGRPTR
jgi:hypothetical protein